MPTKLYFFPGVINMLSVKDEEADCNGIRGILQGVIVEAKF